MSATAPPTCSHTAWHSATADKAGEPVRGAEVVDDSSSESGLNPLWVWLGAGVRLIGLRSSGLCSSPT